MITYIVHWSGVLDFQHHHKARRHHWQMEFRGTRQCTDRKSTRLNSNHQIISYAVFCLKKKKINHYLLSNRYKRSTDRRSSLMTVTIQITTNELYGPHTERQNFFQELDSVIQHLLHPKY